jgi:hypothetical protein
MQAFLEKPLKAWDEEMKQLKQEIGLNPEDLWGVLQGQVAVVISEVGFAKGEPEFHPVVLADIGEHERRVRELIAEVEQERLKDGTVRRLEEEFRGITIVRYATAEEGAKSAEPGPNCWYIDGTTLGIAERAEDLKQVLARKGDTESPSLSDSEAYRRVRARMGENPEVVAYLGMAGIKKLMAEMQQNDMEMLLVTALSGIDNIEGIGMQATLGRGGVAVNGYVSIPNGKKEGMLKFFDAQNSTLVPPKWVPPDAADVTTMAIDFAALLAEGRRIAAKFGAEGNMDMVFEMSKGMGIDIEQDVIGSLGKEITFYSKLPEEGAPAAMFPPFVLAIEIKDKPKLERVFATLGMILQQQGLPIEEEEYMGVKLRTLNMMFFQVSMALLPDQFLIAMSHDPIKDVVTRYGKDVKGLVDGEDFVRAASRLPEGRMAIGFGRFDKAAREGVVGTMLKQSPDKVDMNLFPKPEVIQKYIDIASSAITNEDAGIFYTWILAFTQTEAAEDK